MTERTFPTGSVRDSRDGKGRYDLIPPEPMRRLAKHYEYGATRYRDRNWERGQHLMSYLDSCERHLYQLKEGLTDEDHAAAVAWNIFGYIQTLKWIEDGVLPDELDDRPQYDQPYTDGHTVADAFGNIDAKLNDGPQYPRYITEDEFNTAMSTTLVNWEKQS